MKISPLVLWEFETYNHFYQWYSKARFQNDSGWMAPSTNQNSDLTQSEWRSKIRIEFLRPFLGWFCTRIVIWNTDRFKNEEVLIPWIYSKTRFTVVECFVRFAAICAAGLR